MTPSLKYALISMLWTECFCCSTCPHSYTEALFPNVVILGGGAFEGWLGHRGGILINGISDLIRSDRREMISLPCEGTVRRSPSARQEEMWLSPGPDHAQSPHVRLPASRTVGNVYCLSHPSMTLFSSPNWLRYCTFLHLHSYYCTPGPQNLLQYPHNWFPNLHPCSSLI